MPGCYVMIVNDSALAGAPSSGANGFTVAEPARTGAAIDELERESAAGE
jgi:hypothetical protein